ncbi:hypothetical protein [Thermoanaerobacterium sp. RBIITD]|uniref:hypothetical protein n=1 Tax=Thermoanaerobacterium sp. RBIITD TaxID=1550240 RepID=UPI000BB96085|nr:hypothetical protein [Thermoanaerobacterium sp. RBIITD]SNX52703.1 hypothetical protein SAMN05660242_0125 [Thermoanaerobacterium sp. RBIITD]
MKLNMYNIGNFIVGNTNINIDDVNQLVVLLIEKYGENTLREVLKNRENGQNDADAFKNALSNGNMLKKLKIKENK